MAIKDEDRIPERLGKAVAGILAQVKSAYGAPPVRLPGIRSLADTLGVSRETVHRAVRLLRDQGVLVVVPGGGVFAVDTTPHTYRFPDPVLSPPSAQRRWQVVKAELRRRMLEGTYLPGTSLPAGKVLTQNFGSSHKTVRRALLSLAADQRIEPCGRGYRVTRIHGPSSPMSLVLVAFASFMSLLADFTPRSPHFWRTLEQECLRMGLTLEVWGYHKAVGDESRTDSILDNKRQRGILGYLVWTAFITPQQQKHLLDLIRRTGKPAALLDEMGNAAVGPALLRSSRTRLFQVAVTPLAGRIMGTHLLQLGHRKTAWFLPVASDPLYDARFQGVCESFSRAGLRGGVTRYASRSYASFDEMESSQRNAGTFHPMVRKGHSYLQAMWAVSNSLGGSQMADLITSQIEQFHRNWYSHSALLPLFGAALEDTSITAWVLPNDLMAAAALDYLRQRRVRVPEDLSVAGFDDSPEALGQGLTSYNYGMEAVVYAMLEHVLRYAPSRRRVGEVITEIAGKVLARSSTGPARRT